MSIDDALVKAYGVGWRGSDNLFAREYGEDILDVEFWKSLALALHWPDRVSHKPIKAPFLPTEHDLIDVQAGDQTAAARLPGWRYEWHRFIDHLADGKSTEEFFKNL
jgi:hypothetical protein